MKKMLFRIFVVALLISGIVYVQKHYEYFTIKVNIPDLMYCTENILGLNITNMSDKKLNIELKDLNNTTLSFVNLDVGESIGNVRLERELPSKSEMYSIVFTVDVGKIVTSEKKVLIVTETRD